MKRKRHRKPLQSVPVNHKKGDASSVASSKTSCSTLPLLDDSDSAFLTSNKSRDNDSSNSKNNNKKTTTTAYPKTNKKPNATTQPWTSSSKTPKISNLTMMMMTATTKGKPPPVPSTKTNAVQKKQPAVAKSGAAPKNPSAAPPRLEKNSKLATRIAPATTTAAAAATAETTHSTMTNKSETLTLSAGTASQTVSCVSKSAGTKPEKELRAAKQVSTNTTQVQRSSSFPPAMNKPKWQILDESKEVKESVSLDARVETFNEAVTLRKKAKSLPEKAFQSQVSKDGPLLPLLEEMEEDVVGANNCSSAKHGFEESNHSVEEPSRRASQSHQISKGKQRDTQPEPIPERSGLLKKRNKNENKDSENQDQPCPSSAPRIVQMIATSAQKRALASKRAMTNDENEIQRQIKMGSGDFPKTPGLIKTPKSPNDMDTDESSEEDEHSSADEAQDKNTLVTPFSRKDPFVGRRQGAGAREADQPAPGSDEHMAMIKDICVKTPNAIRAVQQTTKVEEPPKRVSKKSVDKFLQGKADNPEVLALMMGSIQSREEGTTESDMLKERLNREKELSGMVLEVQQPSDEAFDDDLSVITDAWVRRDKRQKVSRQRSVEKPLIPNAQDGLAKTQRTSNVRGKQLHHLREKNVPIGSQLDSPISSREPPKKKILQTPSLESEKKDAGKVQQEDTEIESPVESNCKSGANSEKSEHEKPSSPEQSCNSKDEEASANSETSKGRDKDQTETRVDLESRSRSLSVGSSQATTPTSHKKSDPHSSSHCITNTPTRGVFQSLIGPTPPSPVGNKRERPLPSSSFSNDFDATSIPTWTAELSGFVNVTPFFRLGDGRLFRHTPLPPGWTVEVSKSRQRPYYRHPDFGSTFYPPILMPSNDGLIHTRQVLFEVKDEKTVSQCIKYAPGSNTTGSPLSQNAATRQPAAEFLADQISSEIEDGDNCPATSFAKNEVTNEATHGSAKTTNSPDETVASKVLDPKDRTEKPTEPTFQHGETKETDTQPVQKDVPAKLEDTTLTREEKSPMHQSIDTFSVRASLFDTGSPKEIEIARCATRDDPMDRVLLKETFERKEAILPASPGEQHNDQDDQDHHELPNDNDSPIQGTKETSPLLQEDEGPAMWGDDDSESPVKYAIDDSPPQTGNESEGDGTGNESQEAKTEDEAKSEATETDSTDHEVPLDESSLGELPDGLNGTVPPNSPTTTFCQSLGNSGTSSRVQPAGLTPTPGSHTDHTTPATTFMSNSRTSVSSVRPLDYEAGERKESGEKPSHECSSGEQQHEQVSDAEMQNYSEEDPELPFPNDDYSEHEENRMEIRSFTGSHISSIGSQLSRISYRVCHPTLPVCCLQNVNKLELASSTKTKKSQKSKGKTRPKKKSRSPPRSILARVSNAYSKRRRW